MDAIQYIAEYRIKEAEEKGELDNLDGMGKPLILEDTSHIAPKLRMAYKVLKNAGYIPPEIIDAKEATTILEMLEGNLDEQVRYRKMQKLKTLFARMKKSNQPDKESNYYQALVDRMSITLKNYTNNTKQNV